MKQPNTGSSTRLSVPSVTDAAKFRKKENKPSGFSKTIALLAAAIFLSAQLFSGSALAQIATYVGSGGTSTSVSGVANETVTSLTATGFGSASPCGSGGLSGLTNNGVTTYVSTNARVYFKITPNSGYVVNVTGFTAKLRRSGSGITKVRFAYSLDNGSTWVDDGTDHAPDNVSCGAGSTVHSWGGGSLPSGVTSTYGILIALYPYAPISNGGVIQINNITINGSVTSAPGCSGTPATGTASASPTTVCNGNSTTLTLTGGSTGTGITYQWFSSNDNISFSSVSGATNASYTTSSLSTGTMYYYIRTTCTTSGLTSTSSTATVTINPTPVIGDISGPTIFNIGDTATFTDTTTGGTWSSTTPGVASINATTGFSRGNAVGTTTITYSKTVGGCTGRAILPISVVNPSAAGTLVTFDVQGVTGYGASPLTPTTVNSGATAAGLIRGSGVGTTGTAANNAWGGNNWVSTTKAGAIADGRFAYFTVKAKRGFKINADSLKFAYRRSTTGATNGQLQYSLDGTTFTDVTGGAFSYTSTSSSGALLPTVDLSGIAALHNVNSCTTITFRIVNWGGSGSGGTWYVFDKLTGDDLLVYGSSAVAPVSMTAALSTAIPTAGVPFNVTVSSFDTTGAARNVASNTGITLTTNGFAGAIGGTTTGTITAGTNTVTITGVTLASTGTNVRIIATATSGDCLTPAITDTFTVTDTACSGMPDAGTVAPSSAAFCGSGAATFTLTPGSGGTGITYQWLSASSASGPYSAISGATNLTYNTDTVTTTTYYAVVATCNNSFLSDTTVLAAGTLTINPNPVVAAITGASSVVAGDSTQFSDSTAGGVWTSSNNSIATVDASGKVFGVTFGTATITYTVTSGAGCVTVVTKTINVTMAPFTTGTLVVLRENGTSSAGTSVTLVSYDRNTADQPTPVTAVNFPSTGAGRIVQSGSATSEGHLNLDAEGTHIIFAGYDTTTGVANVATASGINRVIYSVPQSGVPSIVANVPQTGAFRTNNIRSATANGTDYYASGTSSTAATAGIQLMSGSSSLQIQNTTVNTRVTSIYNGQLYYSTASGTGGALGIYSVGTGIPTSGVTANNEINTGDTSGSYGFALSPDGTTMYIADDASATKGIRKYTNTGGTWDYAYTLASNAGARSLAVDWSSVPYTIYATTASGSSTVQDTLIKVIDSNASAVYYRLATSPSGTSFRGVVFAPSCSATITLKRDTVCSGDSTSVVIYGNPGATVNYTVNGAAASVVLGNNGLATVNTGALTTATTFQLVDITTSVCSNTSITGSVTVQVNPTSVADILGNDIVCEGATTQFLDATDGGVWSSDNSTIASVNASGLVYGVTPGATTITYTVSNTCGTYFTTHGILVNPLPSVDSISGTSPIPSGSTVTFFNLTFGGTWSSSNDLVASVDPVTGDVTGTGSGSAVIYYTVTNDCGSITATFPVEVVLSKSAPVTVQNAVKASVTLYPNPAQMTLNVRSLEHVNVVILSMDGKVLISQQDATSINVSSLSAGIYMVKVYNQENGLIKTASFSKQ